MKEISIPIENVYDREKFISILAHAGCRVVVKKEERNGETLHWVKFEVPELNVK